MGSIRCRPIEPLTDWQQEIAMETSLRITSVYLSGGDALLLELSDKRMIRIMLDQVLSANPEVWYPKTAESFRKKDS
jgi:hypothetical protein